MMKKKNTPIVTLHVNVPEIATTLQTSDSILVVFLVLFVSKPLPCIL